MIDAEVIAAANARYEAFRLIFPKMLEDFEAATIIRRDRMGTEARVELVGSAANATAWLVAGAPLASGS